MHAKMASYDGNTRKKIEAIDGKMVRQWKR